MFRLRPGATRCVEDPNFAGPRLGAAQALTAGWSDVMDQAPHRESCATDTNVAAFLKILADAPLA